MKLQFKSHYIILIVLAVFALVENSLAWPPKTTPNTLVVTTLADSGTGSLRQVLGVARPNDIITFTVRGTIFLNTGPLLITTSVRIAGPGADKLIIDAQRQSQVFIVTNNIAVTISDLTIINGANDIFSAETSGGGIRNLGSLTLIRVVVAGCHTESGVGGGIFSQGPLTLQQCSVSNNVAGGGGGGIANVGTGRLTMDATTINNNRTGEPLGSDGGGVLLGGNIGIVTNCTISGNVAFPGNGGGVASSIYIKFESCTIVSNAAFNFGEPQNGRGGGVFMLNATFESRNTIYANNVATNFQGLPPVGAGPDIFGTMFSQGFNLIKNPSGAAIAGVVLGNIIGADPLLGPLQNNGGPVWTHALLPGSPAIDAGSPTDFPRTDARGVARPQDGNGDNIFITDIGAYEKETIIPGSIPGNVIVTTLNDSGPGSLRQALATAPPGSKITFAVQGTIGLTSGPLLINKLVEIAGPGEDDLVIDGQFVVSPIFIVAANATASIFDLSVTNGVQSSSVLSSGSGVRNFGTLTMTRCAISHCTRDFGAGGGINNQGTLTVRQCDIFANSAGMGGGIGDDGFGRLTVDSSTIRGNVAALGAPPAGGGIAKLRGNITIITNATISDNRVFEGVGGGIAVNSYMKLESCTIVSNSVSGATAQGGGLFIGPNGQAETHNTILADNLAALGPDAFGFVFSQGWNLIKNPANAYIAGVLTGNIIGVDPLLGPLQSNGGPAPTHALLPGSPAIDKASPFDFPNTDERGVSRPQDGNGDGIALPDIGAYEKETPPVDP